MSAEGYISAPLSDEMERRIRERIAEYRAFIVTPYHEAASNAISTLEWVLSEAEVIKSDKPSRFDQICHLCGHLHADVQCGMPMGGAGKCLCERRTA